jgi:hypothetical protein
MEFSDLNFALERKKMGGLFKKNFFAAHGRGGHRENF